MKASFLTLILIVVAIDLAVADWPECREWSAIFPYLDKGSPEEA